MKKLLNYFYKISKLIIIFSAVISGWSTIILFADTSFKLEINEVIHKIYLNQKNFIFNVKDLSVLLLKDANYRFSSNTKHASQSNNIEK